MSSFEGVETNDPSYEWTRTLLSDECNDLRDPKFILARAVRSEVVTRLKAERAELNTAMPPLALFDDDERADFLDAMLSDERDAFDIEVDRLALRDKQFTSVLRDMITPVLDDLGQMWRDDQADFLQVTLASCRVQTLVCDILGSTATRNRSSNLSGSIAFARPAGETHTLGLSVVTECFRIDGWNVIGGVDLEVGDSLWATLGTEHLDVLGLSVGSLGQVEPVRDAIAKAKETSKNANLLIGLGGYCAVTDPDLLKSIGADFVSTDALQAIDVAASMLHPAQREA